jgi:hypothetical protein
MDVHSGFVGVTARQLKEATSGTGDREGRRRPFRARLARSRTRQGLLPVIRHDQASCEPAARLDGQGRAVRSLRHRARALEYRPDDAYRDRSVILKPCKRLVTSAAVE